MNKDISFGYNLNYMSLKLISLTAQAEHRFGYNLNYMSLKPRPYPKY